MSTDSGFLTIPIPDIKRIRLSISQVAPLIGLDNYGNFPRIVCEVWRRFNPEEFRELELQLKSAGHQLANASELNDIWEIDDLLGTNILEKVRALNSDTNKTSADMTKSQAAITEYIKQQTGIQEDKKAELVKKVCSVTNKSHGVTNEDSILAEFCTLTDKKLQDTQGWVEIKLEGDVASQIATQELEWVVIGKYDGVTTDGELVEAKMRQKGLFKQMRDYENVQVQLYLHALDTKNAFLVEAFSSSSKGTSTSASRSKTNGTTTTKSKSKAKSENKVADKVADKVDEDAKTKLALYIHDVVYDASYVEEIILARLRNFTKYFKDLMLDTSRKENILKSDPREYARYREEYLGIEELEF
jgi:hypothetical protein